MSLAELADRIGAELVGDGSLSVKGCASIDRAGPDEVTFVAKPKYARFLDTTRAAAVIVDPKAACPSGLALLRVEDPYFAFRQAMVALHGYRQHPVPIGGEISTLAAVHPKAAVGEGTVVHAFATIEAGATVGRRCVLYSGAYVGPEACLGDDCVLYPNVVVYDRCILGNRVVLHANTVVGHDGFGFATHEGGHHKIPQAGIAVIEDDVEMGAGCAIERATVGETRVGQGTKFADLISIGHGTRIGRHCLFVSLVGVSGSVEVGNYVVLGGQAGVTGHLRIGDGAQVAAQSGVTGNVAPGSKVGGAPVVDLELFRRNVLVGRDLHGLGQRLKHLEKELERLKKDRV